MPAASRACSNYCRSPGAIGSARFYTEGGDRRERLPKCTCRAPCFFPFTREAWWVRKWSGWLWWAWLAVGATAIAGYLVGSADRWYWNVYYDLIGLASTAVMLVGVRLNRPA